jgi:hypothetical protein
VAVAVTVPPAIGITVTEAVTTTVEVTVGLTVTTGVRPIVGDNVGVAVAICCDPTTNTVLILEKTGRLNPL